MKVLKPVISATAPNAKDVIWLKPVSDGFVMYIVDEAKWKPLVLVDDQGTSSIADDVKQDLVGKSNDSKTKNTINGAKNYAKDQADTLMGTAEDTAADMTLYGLKAYIDSKTS